MTSKRYKLDIPKPKGMNYLEASNAIQQHYAENCIDIQQWAFAVIYIDSCKKELLKFYDQAKAESELADHAYLVLLRRVDFFVACAYAYHCSTYEGHRRRKHLLALKSIITDELKRGGASDEHVYTWYDRSLMLLCVDALCKADLHEQQS